MISLTWFFKKEIISSCFLPVFNTSLNELKNLTVLPLTRYSNNSYPLSSETMLNVFSITSQLITLSLALLKHNSK